MWGAPFCFEILDGVVISDATSSLSLPTQFVVGHFGSALTLTPQPHRLRAASYKAAPTSNTSHKSWASPASHQLAVSRVPVIDHSGGYTLAYLPGQCSIAREAQSKPSNHQWRLPPVKCQHQLCMKPPSSFSGHERYSLLRGRRCDGDPSGVINKQTNKNKGFPEQVTTRRLGVILFLPVM